MASPAQPNQSVLDGLMVLQAVASAREPIGVRELARQLELEPTKVQRLLGTLAHAGMAERDEKRKYRPGPGIHVLAAQVMFGSGLLRRAMPVLESLRVHGLNVALGVLWRDQVAYLYFASPDTPAGEALGNTALFPAEKSAIGRVLQVISGEVDDPAVRQDGYALMETGPDTHSLAVPIGHPAFAAVALAGGPDAQALRAYAPALRDAADRIAESEATP